MEDTDGSLESYGLVEDSNVSLLLRLRGGAPKKRCGAYISTTDRCSQVRDYSSSSLYFEY